MNYKTQKSCSGMINCEPHEVTSLEHTVWNKKYVTFVLNFLLIFLALSIFDASASMKVRRFEWSPSVVTLGETTTFYWHIEGAEFCFGNNKRRTAVGNNGRQLFTSPTDKTTSWYCQDSSGERIYLNARIRVLPHAPGKASTPFATRYVPINTRQTISWSSVSGADYYNLFQNGSRYYQGYGRSRTISSSTVGTNSYKVNACNAGGCGAWSGSRYVTFFDKPGMVSNLSSNKISLITGESALISWGQASGIVPGFSYQVHLNGSLYKTTTQLSTSVVLDDEGNNTVAVYACNPESVGCSSARTVNINAIGKPATPSSIPDVVGGSYHPYGTTVQLSLPAVANATYYQVFMSTTDSNYQLQSSAKQVTLRGDWGYNYIKYRACNNAGCSELSSWRRTHSYGSPHQAYPTASSNLVTSGNTVKISWPNPRQIIYSGTFYERQIISPSNKVTNLSALNHVSGASSTDYTSPTLVEGGVYTFKVRACNPSLPCGPWGSTNVNVAVAITQAPNLDIGNAYHPINSSKEIKWSSIIGAKRYELYEDSSKIHDYNSLSDSVSHANYGRRYYKVRACNEIGCGPYSTTLPIYYYTAPGGVNNFKATPTSVEVGSNSKLTWDLPGGDVPGISYVISKDGAEISRTTNRYLDVAISSLQNTFSIVACNPENVGCGSARTVSVEGTPITKPTLAPTISNSHYHPINSTINVNATGLNGATNYRLKVETGTLDGANKQEVLNKTFTGSTTSFSSAKAGYHFISYAQCKGNYCSEYSPALRIVVYGAPNYAKSVMADPSSVRLGASSVIKWAFSGVRVGGHYKLKQIRPDGTIKQYANITQPTGVFDFEQATESLSIAGTHTFKVDSCNDDSHCSGDVNVTVDVFPTKPDEIPAVVGGNYQRVNSNVSVTMPIISGAQSYKLKLQTGHLEGTNKQPATESITYQGNIAKFTPQSTGYYFLSYAHCSNGVCSEYGPELRIHVYGKSGEVTGLSVDKDQTFIGMRANINWKWASGIRVNGHYKVTHTLPSGSSNASYNPIIVQEAHDAEHEVMSPTFNVPGNHIFTVQSCNDDSLCSDGVSIDVRVINPVIVNRFEWSPNVVLAGQSTTFYWDVTGVDKCGRTDENDKKGWRAPSGNNGTQVFSIGSDQTSMLVHTKWKCLIDEGKPSEIQYPVGENNFLTANLTVLKEPDGINMPVLSKVSDSLKWTYNSTADNYQIQAASCGDNCREITQSAWETVANVTDKRYLLPELVESKVYRVQACNSQNECGAHSNNVEVTSLNTVKVNRFEWVPNVSLIGQPTTFYWDIGGVENCRRADPEDKKGWRGVVGDNGTQIFEQPFEKDSIWECYTDINDVTTRYPSDPSKFISAPIKVLESPDGVSIPLLKKTSDTLTWSVIANAQRYELQQYACSERCNDLVEANWQLAQENASTSFTLPNDDTKRAYRVKACFADESCTAWSNVWHSDLHAFDEMSADEADGLFTAGSFDKSNDGDTLTLPVEGTGNVIGKTAGQFRVDEGGQATYHVPFDLPIGPGGIRPELGLSYSSANTSLGNAGIGWSLTGLSVIQRCARNDTYDDLADMYLKDVQFDETDAYCVNGARLIETSNNVYRLESDNFTLYERFVSDGVVTGFVATTKANERFVYGNPNNIGNDSAIRSVVSVITGGEMVNFSWHIAAILDVYGNEISYNYSASGLAATQSEELLLRTISYGPTTVTLNYSSVNGLHRQFNYLYGVPFSKTQKLINVIVQSGTAELRRYVLKYPEGNDVHETQYLASIQECYEYYSGYSCKDKLEFDWQEHRDTSHWLNSPYDAKYSGEFLLGNDSTNNGTQIIDFNGDGYSDIVYFGMTDSFTIKYGNDLGIRTSGRGQVKNVLSGDFNGDGRQDILYEHSGNIYMLYNEPTVTTGNIEVCFVEPGRCDKDEGAIRSQQLLNIDSLQNIKLGDINGDGRLDLLDEQTLIPYLNLREGMHRFQEQPELFDVEGVDSSLEITSLDILTKKVKEIADFNGDGVLDVLVTIGRKRKVDRERVPAGFELILMINQAGSYSPLWSSVIAQKVNTLNLENDYNGDGLPDAFFINGSSYVMINNGAGFNGAMEVNFSEVASRDDDGTLPLDIDGDSKIEYLQYNIDSKDWTIYSYIYDGNSLTKIEESEKLVLEKQDDGTTKDLIYVADTKGTGEIQLVNIRYTQGDINATVYDILTRYKRFRRIEEFYTSRENNYSTVRNSTYVDYKPLTDSTVYLGRLESRHPFIGVVNSMHVVAHATTKSSGQEDVSIQYQYANLALHSEGRGYLGFGKLVTLDNNHPNYTVRTTTLYHQGFDPEIGMKAMTSPNKIGKPYSTTKEVVSEDGTIYLLSQGSNTYAQHTTATADSAKVDSVFVYLEQAIDKAYFLEIDDTGNVLGSTETSTTTTTNIYDTYGNVTKNEVKVTQGTTEYSTVTDNTYSNSATCFGYSSELTPVYAGDYAQFGRLSCSKVTKTRNDENGVSTANKVAAFAYNIDGVLYQEMAQVHSADLRVKTEYQFDAYGNVERKITTGKQAQLDTTPSNKPTYRGTVSQLEQFGYDSTGRFIEWQGNSLGHRVCYGLNKDTGRVESKTTNVLSCDNTSGGLTTTYRYNVMGQLTGEQAPDGTIKLITRSARAFPYAYREKVSVSGGLDHIIYYDDFGRAVVKEQATYSGSAKRQYISYDKFGRVYRQSIDVTGAPTANQYHVTEYDFLGRVVSKTSPSFDGSTLTMTYDYAINSVTETQSATGIASVSKTTVTNALGDVLSVTDNDGGDNEVTTTFTYYAYGQLKTSQVNSVHPITIEYDALGNKVQTDDPDKGQWQYRYNALGQLKWQKDAKGQVTWLNYDALGRVTQRIDGAGSSKAQSRCFNYDSLLPLGAKNSEYVVTGSDCAINANRVYQKDYVYDDQGRPESVKTYITQGEHTYSQLTKQFYDGLGRVYLKQIGNNYALGYTFDTDGKLTETHGLTYHSDTQSISSEVLQTVGDVNFRGQAESVTYLGNQTLNYGYDLNTGLGTGMTTSGIDNDDHAGGIVATYQYNAFGQLDKRSFDGLFGDTRTETFTYDTLNRMATQTVKFGAADITKYYCYDLRGNMLVKGDTQDCDSATAHFSYGENGEGPHALTTHHQTGQTYHYDDNGNMHNDGKRSFTYSAFDKVIEASESNNLQVQFKYGANHARYYRKDTYLPGHSDAQALDTETFYFGGLQRIAKEGSLVYQYAVGNVLITYDLATGDITKVLQVKDHLGSVIATTKQDEDGTGQVQQAYYYDPFGQQFAVTPATSEFEALTRGMRFGFTGHEMVNGLNFIHMNGRIYDPTLGRFLQADPHIQAPYNSQSYNRYSYVLNNPLSYTDPSGYFFKKMLRGIAKVPVLNAVVQLALGAVCQGAAAVCLAAYNGMQSYAVTGNIGASVKSAYITLTSATVFSAIGGKFGGEVGTWNATNGPLHIASHALAGGVIAELQGGKFGHGFFSAGLTKGLTPQFEGVGDTAFEVGGYNIAEAAIAAVLGGTISKATGGKFANGAITAAMANLFNNQRLRKDAVGKAHEAFMKKTGVSKKQLNALLELGDSVYKLHEGLENKLAFENMMGDMNNKQLISLSKALGVSEVEINMVNDYGGDNSLRANLFRKYRATHFFDSLSNAANAAKAAQNVIYIDPAVKHLPKWLAHAYNANSHLEYLQSLKGN